MEGFIELNNDFVSKAFMMEKRSEYNEHDQDMFIDNLIIRAQSTDTRLLRHVVEII